MAVTNDLATDRRVQRHAATLRSAGYAVLLLGRGDLYVRSSRSFRFYAEYNLRLFFRLLRTGCDIVWANDSDTLPACWLAARLKRRRLVLDAHEIFPELPEVVGRKHVQRVWRIINRMLIPRCDALLTVCQSFADYYREQHGVDMQVVRNLQPTDPLLPPLPHTAEHPVLLYQGAVNVGRGVDWAIDALEWLPQCRLVVAGTGDVIGKMRDYAASKPWADRVQFLGRLSVETLETLTPQADIGLLMLEDRGLSYRLTLPNRVGDFVAAGVPIVASPMPETAAIVQKYGIGELLDAPGPRPLADAVQRLLLRWSPLGPQERLAAFDQPRRDLDWNREQQRLLSLVQSLHVRNQYPL